ncbi:DUF4811 domain-containing protein [Weissella paramesenteroides]|uniref:DUF4811 domain-containing protein n=1 Tax=Weissella paramesenteroides TaxID=1249 RepID=UPI002E7AB4E0|nr:DUF4811 domain-containing protein [Weissella paramesenteroides]WPQ68101.1 DUF4811 domain-containing protein [Weissella paramesenteroides]
MILWIIVILMVLTIVSLLLIKNKRLRYGLGGLFAILLIASVAALSANMSNHFGMEKVTQTKTKAIYSAAPANVPVGMLMAKKIEQHHYVLVYKDAATDKKATAHFAPDKDDMLNSLKKTASFKKVDIKQAQLTTRTTKWQYSSDFTKWLFKMKEDNHLVHVKYTAKVPLNWQVIEK